MRSSSIFGAKSEVVVRIPFVAVGSRLTTPTHLPVDVARAHLNLKTAKALGLEIPPTLLARANEVVIE